MWPNQQFLADLVTFTEEILNGKLNFLCSVTTNTNKIVEKETLLVNNDEIAKTFKRHFTETTEKLNTFEWPSNNENLTEETPISTAWKVFVFGVNLVRIFPQSDWIPTRITPNITQRRSLKSSTAIQVLPKSNINTWYKKHFLSQFLLKM